MHSTLPVLSNYSYCIIPWRKRVIVGILLRTSSSVSLLVVAAAMTLIFNEVKLYFSTIGCLARRTKIGDGAATIVHWVNKNKEKIEIYLIYSSDNNMCKITN